MPSRLLTPKQAAEILNVQEQTLAAWRSTRRTGPDYVKIGRAVRYPADAVERYVASRTVRVASDRAGITA